MLFKISLSNIRRSFRDYTIYFFTLVIGISVFYVFNAIGTQAAYMTVTKSRSDIIALLKDLLSGVSVFVSIVLGLLIVYASRFLMKRRKREFAIYLTLGMSKGTISLLLLLETLLIGMGSLAAGLIAGVGLSQLMSALVANLFEADMSAYRFTLSGEAVVKTILCFGITYLVVMLFNSFTVGKFKLIDLIQSDKKAERLYLKNPVLCGAIFLAACAALGYAYRTVSNGAAYLQPTEFMVTVGVGAVATFLIFWSAAGLLLRLAMAMKPMYFRGLNAFTFRQISSKISTTVVSMTVICLMLFVTICTLSAAFSIRNSMNDNIRSFCPADFELEYAGEHSEEISGEPSGETENGKWLYTDVVKKCDAYDYDITQYFSEYVHFHTYTDSSFTLEKSLGDSFKQIENQYSFIRYDTPEDIVRLSDYNALMQLYGRESLTLENDEFIVVCNFQSMRDIRDATLAKGTAMEILGHTLRSKYDECLDGFIDLTSQPLNAGIFIVPDRIADESYADTDLLIGKYAAQTDEEYAVIEARILKDFDNMRATWAKENDGRRITVSYRLDTKTNIVEATVGLGAIVTFLGLYIGLVFLIACGAILALKELSESVNSLPRYLMLRKIGVEEHDISCSLFVQIGIFFLLPLLLACLHSVFGMKFGMYMLEMFGTSKLTESVLITSLMILLIYGGYFLITYLSSKTIIKGNDSD